ncbi:MAG: hypothetical protein ACLQJR_28695 [Stellaceae bacterium]
MNIAPINIKGGSPDGSAGAEIHDIVTVKAAATETSEAANEVFGAASTLTEQSERFKGEVSALMAKARAA